MEEKTGTAESSQEKKDRELFNNIAEEYCRKDISASSRIPRKHRLLRTFSALPRVPGMKILEVGCGCGYSADYLEGLYGRYIGVDYAARLIEYAREYNRKANASFVAANVNNYVPDEELDVVLMVGVLHHFDDYQGTFTHLLRFLKPGGWLLLNEPQSANILIQAARKARAILDKGYSSEQRTFSRGQLRALFEENHLSNIKIIPQGALATPLAEVILRPDFLFVPVAKMAVLVDKAIESFLAAPMKYLSWNLIVAGQKR